MKMQVVGVQYPNVLVHDHEPIPISSIQGFNGVLPCTIEPDGGMYVVVTDNVPPPADSCAV